MPFRFVINEVMEDSLEGFQDVGVDVPNGENEYDLLLFVFIGSIQHALDNLATGIAPFSMHFAPPKCILRLQVPVVSGLLLTG